MPVHEVIAMWQERILTQLLVAADAGAAARLGTAGAGRPGRVDHGRTARAADQGDLRRESTSCPPGEYTNRKPAISSLRRNLQRIYLKRLAALAMGDAGGPQDCQTVAYAELAALESRITNLLKADPKLDDYSRAHLDETAGRIRKVVDARSQLVKP